MSKQLTHGSLFSGIGGFDLGAQMSSIPTLWSCEFDPRKRAILHRHLPNTHQYHDILEMPSDAPSLGRHHNPLALGVFIMLINHF